jgi:HNH endonuclease
LKTSEQLVIGQVYTRKELGRLFNITDATMNTGIFRPTGHDSVWLFITKNKTRDRVQYRNEFVGNDLYADSQLMGRKDRLVLDSDKLGLELLVFYRESRYEFDGAGFRYEGPFRYMSSKGRNPRRFHLKRATDVLRLVGSAAQVRRATWQFNAHANDWKELARDLARRTDYWVYDRSNEMFGPAKFVGFANMEFEKYERARKGKLKGAHFDGHSTMNAVSKVLKKNFEPSANLKRLLLRWGENLLGKDCFKGIDHTRWAFAVLSVPHAAATMDERCFASVERELEDMEELDQRQESLVRKEQTLLRRLLFGKNSKGFCALCGQKFPVELLVASHIKRRSECSRGEKKDYRNNVLAMCRFGCDELFERGYMLVDQQGLIQRNTRMRLTPAVEKYMKKIVGCRCGEWNGERAPYFRWCSLHLQNSSNRDR